MKPSISIDLPGWCTLQRDTQEDADEQLQELLDEAAGSASTPNPEGRASSCNGNEDSDDDDHDDAIARLFSVGGLKRRRSSDSRLQAGEGSTRRKKAGSGGSRRGSAECHVEAYLDWPCVRCTFINAYTDEACGGCGGGNKKRERLLRERREEAEKRGRLQSLRDCRDKSLKEEAFKDVLEDSSDDESDDKSGADGSQARGEEPVITAAVESPVVAPSPGAAAAENSSSNTAPSLSSRADDTQGSAAAKAAGSQAERPQEEADRAGSSACVINLLPPDLLLQCSEYLGDARSLCRVRGVCFAWTVSLDDREAGRRLWRPLFYRLRASGSIDRATDTTGRQTRKLKVYDLGSATAATPAPDRRVSGGAATAGSVLASSTGGVVTSTPSPSQQQQRSSPFSSSSSSGIGGFSAPGKGASSGSVGNASAGAVSSSCVVCGLIQREGYSGRDCEMCASALTPVQARESPAAPRLAYTRVNLSGGAARGSPSPFLPHQRDQRRDQQTSVAGASSSPSVLHERTQERIGGGGVSADGATSGATVASTRVRTSSTHGLDEGEVGNAISNVDWHFLVKRLAEEKRIAGGWGSLHHGWVWLQRALQTMLRRRRGNEPCAVSGTLQTGGMEPGVPSHLRAPQQQQQQQATCSTADGRATGDASLGELDPTIARLVRKLASKKWVLLYDSLKATFTLQAEGIAREVVFEAMAAAANAAARDAMGGGTEAAPGKRGENAAAAELEGLRGCIAAWEAYKDWCEEVDMYCELLNEQISAERYRTAGAGCGRGDNTPYIRDTALLSFRHSFALNVQICGILRMAISKGMPRTAGREDSSEESGPHLKVRRVETSSGDAVGQGTPAPTYRSSTLSGGGGGAAGASALESAARGRGSGELFTDLELMEDSRAIDFSVRSLCGSGLSAGGGGGSGSGRGPSGRTGNSASLSTGACGGGGSGGGGGSASSKVLSVALSSSRHSSRRSRPGDYYDWFLSRLEGKEAGIIRGDIDARGKRVVPPGSSSLLGGVAPGGCGGGSRKATLAELLDMVSDMVEELDVPDDALSKDRHTQGALRRLLFLPIKRWQAAEAEANSVADEDPENLLLAGLSPAPGKEGFHRLREGAAGRRKGTAPLRSLGSKDAGKSWQHLSTLFG
ncbi:unnamed protein product [Scytosiphon promiscuus]